MLCSFEGNLKLWPLIDPVTFMNSFILTNHLAHSGPAVAIFSVFQDHALRLPGGVSHAVHHGSGIPFLAPSLITSTSL